jgi:CheY-like chemotaxis protein
LCWKTPGIAFAGGRDGQAALDAVAAQHPDLIVLDVMFRKFMATKCATD